MDNMERTAWQRVELARNTKRPTAKYYIEQMMENFMELHGDQLYRDDPAIIGGIGTIGPYCVTVIGQEKGDTIENKARCNFGCAHPEGYRKSLRLMKQAEKFGRPVICIVDTQGAYCGIGAEERGMGRAIAENLQAMAMLEIPIVSVLVGEGGSGGALALAVANQVAMLENSVYSILSPEGFASILFKDGTRAIEAAELMKMTAREVKQLGIIDQVIPEPDGGAHQNPEKTAAEIKAFILSALDGMKGKSGQILQQERYEKFRKMGTSSIHR